MTTAPWRRGLPTQRAALPASTTVSRIQDALRQGYDCGAREGDTSRQNWAHATGAAITTALILAAMFLWGHSASGFADAPSRPPSLPRADQLHMLGELQLHIDESLSASGIAQYGNDHRAPLLSNGDLVRVPATSAVWVETAI